MKLPSRDFLLNSLLAFEIVAALGIVAHLYQILQ